MAYLYEVELHKEAEKFIRALEAAGILGRIAPDGFRDYLVKIAVTRGQKSFGNVNLYYTATKQSFSLKCHELKDKSITPDLEMIWAEYYANKQTPKPTSTPVQLDPSKEYEAYVDGSFIEGPVGYGTLILKAGKPIYEIGATVEDPTLLDMHQVGGELYAVYAAIKWCQNNHVPKIALFYDYEGIESWATGRWKTNNPATQAYANFIRVCGVEILWNKVKSHTGNPWNDYVDRLAKQGSQSKKPAPNQARDELSQILEKTYEFVLRLQKENVEANVIGIMNGQFVRVMILPRGQIDIYNTRKRSPEQPYLTNFTSPQLQEKFEALWISFYRGETNSPELPAKAASAIAEAEHFYKIMESYRDCWFDFSDFANALKQACEEKGLLSKFSQIPELTHDFNALENIYQKIKQA